MGRRKPSSIPKKETELIKVEIKRYGTRERMSAVNEHNGVLYLAGKTAADKSVGAAEQTRQILADLENILNEHGSDKHHMLSALIHLDNFADFDEMNSVWDKWVELGTAPARTCVGGVTMAAGSLVEITVIAAKK